jgi:predicted ATP-grasp superfamily ATP-dependent carboligase
LLAFDYRGLVNVEFKRDTRDGTLRLVEINPRTVGWNQLAVSAGIDFPWINYQYLSGDVQPVPATDFRQGVKYVNEYLEIRAFLAGRRAGDETLRSWVASLVGTRSFAVASLRDPLPFIFQAKEYLAGLRRSSLPA